MLQPLDVLVALKLAVNDRQYTQAKLAAELDVSPSQVNRALRSGVDSGLLEEGTMHVHGAALNEFLLHGVRYAFPGRVGSITRGMATAHAAPPLNRRIRSGEPLVWPDASGDARGQSLEPLYRNAVSASRKDSELYEALALLDAIRVGRARERQIASKLLSERILGKK